MSELQKFFEQSVTGLLEQGVVSKEDAWICSYHSGSGAKCAIGMCITDEAYNHIIESRSVHSHHVEECLHNSGWSSDVTDNKDFLEEMQHCHDNVSPEEWVKEFILIGEKYKLNTDFINKEAN